MDDLILQGRRGGTPITWASGTVITVDGDEEWVVRGPLPAIAEVRKALGSFAEPVDSGVLLLSFGNSIGLVPVPGRAALNVVTQKCGEAELERMFGDIARMAGALPFSAGDRARLALRRTTAGEQVPFHAFLYLRHILSMATPSQDSGLAALRLVLADPHRRLVRKHAWRRLERVSRVGPRTLRSAVAAPGGLVRVSRTLSSTAMAVALRGHLPRVVEEPRADESFDTPENRLVKAFLDLAMYVLARVERAALALKPAGRGLRLRAEVLRLRSLLHPIVRDRFWTEIGVMEQVPMTSTVLQQRRGYRDLFRHYLRLQQAPAWLPLSAAEAQELAEAKDIAKLYEIWCFFQVLDAVKASWGEPESAALIQATELELGVRRGLDVRWKHGALSFNARFSPELVGRRSYSLPLYPDVALRVGTGARAEWHLFDAKFRLARPPGTRAGLEDTSFKPEDLVKMHGYRDALQARSVRVLYPGWAEPKFFETASGAGGVGAVALAPGGPIAALREIVAALLR